MVWSISHLAFAAASSATMFGFDAGVDTLTSRMTGTSFVTYTIFSTGFPTSSSSEISIATSTLVISAGVRWPL